MFLNQEEVSSCEKQAIALLKTLVLIEEIKKIQPVTSCDKCDGYCNGKSDNDGNY